VPIYEFKCLECNEYFEILTRSREEEIRMECPECRSENFERVLSTTNFAMGGSGTSGAKTEKRQCSSGSCTTYEIPGATR
jgi:putative FmdB family regulatory protein